MEELPHRPVRIRLKRGRFGDPFYASVSALNLSGNLSPAVKLVTDDAANFRAMELAGKLKDSPGSPFSAVYLIAPDDMDVVKIGHATDPKMRLSLLQVGNWHQLSVKGLLWVDSGPGLIEGLAHQAAIEMGIRIRGEWFEASIEEAAELVLKAARYGKKTCYDSDIWVKNWSSRVDALAEASGIKNRLVA